MNQLLLWTWSAALVIWLLLGLYLWYIWGPRIYLDNMLAYMIC